MKPLPITSVVDAPQSVVDIAWHPHTPKTTLGSLLGRVPYKLTLGCAFVLGCALLQAYLVSIDHVPTDLLSLLGLATLVSAWLALLWLFATVFMFGPVFTFMLYDVKPLTMPVMGAGLACGAALMLWAVVPHDASEKVLLAMGVAAGVASVVGLFREKPRRTLGQGALAQAAMVLGGAALPICVLLLVITAGVSAPSASWSSEWTLAGYIVFLGALIVTNAWAAAFGRAPIGLWALGAGAAAVVFTAVAGWQVVPTILAERVGIRIAGNSTVLVPAPTCRVIAVGVSDDGPSRDRLLASCEAQVSKVNGTVQLRWGGRMLLAVERLNGIEVPPGHTRVTISDAEAQLVLADKPQ